MHEKFIGHMQTGLAKLKAAAESGRLRDETLAAERLGLKQANAKRAALPFRHGERAQNLPARRRIGR